VELKEEKGIQKINLKIYIPVSNVVFNDGVE
jgi:hypothetical protein